MKSLYIYMALITFLLFGCKRDSLTELDIVEVYPDSEKQLLEYRKTLLDFDGGWEFLVQKDNGQELYGYLDFLDTANAAIISSYNSNFAEADTTKLSLEVFKSNPTLRFPKNSAFESLASSSGNVDTIYTFKSINADTIVLQGEYKKSTLKLSKKKVSTSLQEKVAVLKQGIDLLSLPKFFFNITPTQGSTYFFYKDEVNGGVVFHYLDGNDEKYHFSKVRNTIDGLVLLSPLALNGKNVDISSLTKKSADTYSNVSLEIKNSTVPSHYKNAISDFLRVHPDPNREDNVWLSNYSWSVRNKLDGDNMKAIREDIQSVFNYRNFNSQSYHQICLAWFPGFYWYAGALAINHTVTSDNLLKFTYYAPFGASSRPDVTSYMTSMRGKYTNTSGNYVLKTIGDQIILVNADKSENWIFFR